MSLQNLSVIGYDGTNVNTGWKGEAPHSGNGRLHKGTLFIFWTYWIASKRCEKNPVVKFDQIDCTLQPLDLKDIEKLSTDQQYLYRICLAIKDGSCSSSVTDNSPGKLSHARWLTTANRLLRLYIGTPSPSQNLIILLKYVMLVYAPMWFEIKMKSICQYGAQHFWKMISLAKQIPDKVKQIIYKVFSNKAYFAYPEHLLLSMLHDSRKHIRELAVRRILGARDKKTKNSGGLRFFKLPKRNFEAADYIDLIDWPNCVVTEAPLTMHIKDKDLKEMCKEEQFPVLCFEEYPYHTQSVERCVKLYLKLQ
ncbi:hypothetical protein AVEN_125122-1 [Araneus ventricosus]|uniref:Uncharacterized protein n=1 Tax=Araneus ventricosus TaxID=182803 RepID=A0A4Y2FQZ0_ARAVE|nr:hypothetical protein AVEN_125122-1 [Araneus ventricosus]